MAIASSRLNELRIKSVSELNTELGKKNITLDSTSRYKLTQYICTDLFNNPLDPTNPDNTCSKTLVDGDLARQILLKVEDKNDPNRVLYQIQTVFTRLSS
ncbi:hypothetical protein IQ225_08690 [Synechocystis salina LEGE 06155]|nr:hypothetical protein [Synechocystis salina LEGE 06155]